jgi:hypothetical protein
VMVVIVLAFPSHFLLLYIIIPNQVML